MPFEPDSRRPILYQPVSKKWYLLPLLLSVIGGVITYAIFRNKNPAFARNSMLVGIIPLAALIALSALSPYSDNNPEPLPDIDDVGYLNNNSEPLPDIDDVGYLNMSAIEIKNTAKEVPYEFLMEYNDAYTNDIIHYRGHVTGVHSNNDGSYDIMIEMYDTDDVAIRQDRLTIAKYTPETSAEHELVAQFEDNSGLLTFANSKNSVHVWGTFNGLGTFNFLMSEYEVPETQVLLLETITGGSSDVAEATHTVSYEEIPNYADTDHVVTALEDAIAAWERANPGIRFELVEDNADVNVKWSKWMPMDRLGTYVTYDVTSGQVTTTKHEIDILLGRDDCNSEYQQFAYESLRHTIAHEIGHYLGLRHVDDPESLMHTGGFNDADDIFSYKTHGYKIPDITMGEHRFLITASLLQQIEQTRTNLVSHLEQRAELKKSGSDVQELDANKATVDSLTDRMTSLENKLVCVNDSDVWSRLSATS